jgi:hypothetical protein
MPANSRGADRVPILGELKGEVMVFEPLVVKEIGPSGATIETRFPLHLDWLHELRLTLGTTPVVVKARVVHSHITEVDQDTLLYRSGVEFVETPHHVHVALEKFVEAIRAERSGQR